MTDPRPPASLTSSLLARRGDARPAMRRQPITHLHLPISQQDDLGWNDIGDDQGQPPQPTVTSLAAMTPPDAVEAGYDDAELDSYGNDAEDTADAEDGRETVELEPRIQPVIAPETAPEIAPSAASPLTHHLEAIAQRINQQPPTDSGFRPMVPRDSGRKSESKAQPGRTGRKAAFTLRINPERHLRLRLLSAMEHRSSQQLLIEALDKLLASHDKVEDLAEQVEDNVGLLEEDHGLQSRKA